jgi:hypothetical protein
MNDPHHFEFDLDQGIRAQVVEKLEASLLLPLSKGLGPNASGIYALYLKGTLVYIGKASQGLTKSKRTLRSRLNEHVAKISQRQNIWLDDMTCRYLTFISEWWVFAAEFALMVHYKPEWKEKRLREQNAGPRATRNRKGESLGPTISATSVDPAFRNSCSSGK